MIADVRVTWLGTALVTDGSRTGLDEVSGVRVGGVSSTTMPTWFAAVTLFPHGSVYDTVATYDPSGATVARSSSRPFQAAEMVNPVPVPPAVPVRVRTSRPPGVGDGDRPVRRPHLVLSRGREGDRILTPGLSDGEM